MGSLSLGSCTLLGYAPFLRTQTWRPSARLSWPRSSNRTGASRRRWGRRFDGRKQGALAEGHDLPDLGPQHRPRVRPRPEREPATAGTLSGPQRTSVNSL